MAIEIIRLNLIPEGNPPVVHCKQYDNGRVFQIVLYNGKDPYILTTETIELNIRKSDRHIVTADLPFVVGEHCVDVTTTEQMCAVAGKNTAEIRIIRDGINIGTLNFFMQIERSPMENGLESDSEINNLARQVHDNVVQELADHGAKETGYDNTESELEATNVQDAIDEVNEKIENIPTIDAYTKEETDTKFATKESLETLSGVVDGKANTTDVTNALANKLDKSNPTGSGSLSFNRKPGDIGNRSVAIGDGNTASGTASFAMGTSTIANHKSQFVFGAFNTPDDSTVSTAGKGNYIEIIGNGTGIRARSNARTLDWNGNETLAGDLIFNGNKSLTSEITRLDNRINSLPNPVVFQGTLGVGGTITELPVASVENDGYMYKVITAGTYQEIECKVGDALISKSTEWVLIPAGDTDTDTWRNIKVNGTEVLGNGISSGFVDFVGSENIDIEFDSDGNTIGIKTKNIYTETEVNNLVAEAIYDVLPSEVASGSVATFETDLALPLKSAKFDVNAVQDLHGQDYPFPAGGGKNLFPPKEVSVSGVTITLRADGGIQINGTTTSAFNATVTTSLKAGEYTLSCRFSGTTPSEGAARCQIYHQGTGLNVAINNQDNTNMNKPVVVSEDLTGVEFRIRVSANFNYQNVIYYPQLEKGSTMTNFVPYAVENVCPIEGWSEVSVGYVNFNQLARPTTTVSMGITTTMDSDGVMSMSGTTINVYANITQPIPLVVGHIYLVGKVVIANPNNIAFNWGFLNSARTPYSSASPTTLWNVYKIISSTGQSTGISGLTANTVLDGMKIKIVCIDLTQALGETLANYLHGLSDNGVSIARKLFTKDYYPYNAGGTLVSLTEVNGEQVCPVDIIQLGGTYYGGHLTQDKYGHRQFIATHKKLILNGTENWSVIDEGTATRAFIDRPVDKKLNDTSTICNRFGYGSATIVGKFDMGNTYFRFNIYGIANSKESFNTWLRENETYVVYPLETSIVIDLPDGTPITTVAGVNNIFCNTGNTEVEYKESTDKYVENKLDETCYTKSEDDTFLNAKADKSTTYTKTEVNSLLNGKAKAPTVITGTLVAGQTSITLQSSAITNNSTIFVYTTDGTEWNTVVATTGQVVITFDAQASDLGVKVEVT